ncbi:hypothetical protein PUNSTDRAFT_54555 [Punctularia strigosozonata HHB-11173 SS5]|uniref:uncharacterized protein n=1 Tax=Punctularia strigosozonata (strain HHB-11173) TaxID=741275 RepID=UPI0004416670|nr:uncharacterized protein PUNSTDRAFT_54555 [Punctularia strigosozonata HHB-11173 SS5]EIN06335.1 hypothetical protein PUNSTDRAFT_54555 [Punctularia strigosozonata HHB-11173 SS5]
MDLQDIWLASRARVTRKTFKSLQELYNIAVPRLNQAQKSRIKDLIRSNQLGMAKAFLEGVVSTTSLPCMEGQGIDDRPALCGYNVES